jgi:hypothetical protein
VESFYVWGNEHQVLNLNGVYGVRVKKEGKRDGSAPGNQKNSSGPKEKEIPGGILRRR